MTKICGIVTFGEDEPPAEMLERIYQASWQDNFLAKETWTAPGVGLGHLNLGKLDPTRQPCFRPSGREAIVYCGRIFGYESRKAALIARGAQFAEADSQSDFMLHLVSRTGSKHLTEVNGLFSAAIWDASARRLLLISDRYGFRPIYYYHDEARGLLVFSSDLRAVIASGAVPLKPDWQACSCFLHFGHNLGDATLFRSVKLVPPASVLTFQNHSIQVEKYWDLNDLRIDEKISYPDVIERSTELFRQAIRRRNSPVRGRKVVFLSGGLDSRRIAAELKRAQFDTYTAGWDADSPDPASARRVAEVLGVHHRVFRLPAQGLMLRYWPRTYALVDYETKLHQWVLPMVDQLPPEISLNYDGIAGDIPFNAVRRDSVFVRNGAFQAALSDSEDALAPKLLRERLDLSVLSNALRRHLSPEAALVSTKAELRKYASTPNRLTYFYLMNRTRRAISLFSMKLVLLRCETAFPFLDNDLLDFIMAVPPEMKLANRLREDSIDWAYPTLRDIPTAVYRDQQGRDLSWQRHPNYRTERRRFFLNNVRRKYLRHNWMFSNVQAAPRLLRDLIMYLLGMGQVSYIFSESFTTFFAWLARYFPRGVPPP